MRWEGHVMPARIVWTLPAPCQIPPQAYHDVTADAQYAAALKSFCNSSATAPYLSDFVWIYC